MREDNFDKEHICLVKKSIQLAHENFLFIV